MAPQGAIRLPAWRTLIPGRRESGADEALVFRQRGDLPAIIVVELDAECIPIRLLALVARRLRDRGDARLVEQPPQRDLRGSRVVLFPDCHERLVGRGA